MHLNLWGLFSILFMHLCILIVNVMHYNLCIYINAFKVTMFCIISISAFAMQWTLLCSVVELWLLCNGKCYRKLGHYLAELFYYKTLDVFCSAVFFKHIKRVIETILELYFSIERNWNCSWCKYMSVIADLISYCALAFKWTGNEHRKCMCEWEIFAVVA